jgi:hypothetical protein
MHCSILQKPGVMGLDFLAQRYCVSTVGLDETIIRAYIREQEKIEKQQLELKIDE